MQDLKKRRLVASADRNDLPKQVALQVWVPAGLLPTQSTLSLSPPHAGFKCRFLYRAGEALVLHKDSHKQEAWNKLKETNPLLRTFVSLRQSYDESENPVISSMRSVTEGIGSWFDENETAQVTRLMKNMDPTFTREGFERELREYIVPEVVDAYLSADKEALQAWCGEAVSKCNCCSITSTHRFVDIQRTLGYYGTLSSSRSDQW